MSYATLLTEQHRDVASITFNRAKVLNALNSELLGELGDALDRFDADDAIGAIVLAGNDKAFAAGADIAEMLERDSVDMYMSEFLVDAANHVANVRKPMIAAVGGYALGGGCELVMACDIVVASENARFGQPEIRLGVLPGFGGTQRLPRAVGKAKAMDLCLTGRMMDATEAERAGLVSRVVAPARLMEEAMEVAHTIAGMSRPATYMVKEAINRAYETGLTEGCMVERRLFQAAFAHQDKREGMQAFLDKREPK